MSLLVLSEMLVLFVNTLTTDEKYSLRKRDNLQQAIQMQLSNQKNFNLNQTFNIFLKRWASQLIYFRN